MNEQTIDARVTKIVAEQLGWDLREVNPDSCIFDDLGADSLDALELVMALEDEFACEISDAEAEQVKTVAEAIALVMRSAGVTA